MREGGHVRRRAGSVAVRDRIRGAGIRCRIALGPARRREDHRHDGRTSQSQHPHRHPHRSDATRVGSTVHILRGLSSNLPWFGAPGWQDELVSSAATPKGERRRQALVEAAADLLARGRIRRGPAPLGGHPRRPSAGVDHLLLRVAGRPDRVGRRTATATADIDVMRGRVDDVTHRRRGPRIHRRPPPRPAASDRT